MKYRPILFSGPMVRALLDGRKTQTRRVVKAPNSVTAFRHFHEDEWDRMQGNVRGDTVRCPYGQPGDRLWVRETWSDECDHHWVMYRADHRAERRSGGELFDACSADELRTLHVWSPSIHMPRWASRITLEVTGVRVERLQNISEADAMAEGCGMLKPYSDHWQHRDVAKEEYRCLWETLHPRMGETWGHNPWVWVVEFKRVEGSAS